jgi:threonine dehydrogenase-like Zn-dependent dehydrogenase
MFDTVQNQIKEGVMQAGAIVEPGVVRLVDTAVPEPGADEVRVRLEGCGVCASNLELWGGQSWFDYPLPAGVPGHEGWGIVDRMGDRVSKVRVGDRVAMLSANAYAQYDIAKEDAVIRIPDLLEDQDVPAEPLGCAVNIFRRSQISPGQNVAVVGIGFLGALLVQMASNAGANVVAVTRRRFALDIAEKMGAAHLIEMNDPLAVKQQVKDLTAGEGCSVVIEATGKSQPLELAAQLIRERGRLVIAGYHQDGPRQVNMQLWNWLGIDVVNAHERDPKVYLAGMRQALDMIADGSITPSLLYTHAFTLGELGTALDMTASRPDGFMKALIKL